MGSAQKVETDHKVAFLSIKSGGIMKGVGAKLFNTNFRIFEDDRIVLINADQIVRIDIIGKTPSRQVKIHLANGDIYELAGPSAESVIETVEKDLAEVEQD